MRLLVLVTCLLGLSAPAFSSAEYVGSKACAQCHQTEHAQWSTSHHQAAMAKPSRATVLAPFEGEAFVWFGKTTRFHQKDDRFFITTDDFNKGETIFEVTYTFGIYPLQQYLIPTHQGRLQSFTVAWDARPSSEGGQRWYHLTPDEYIAPDDPLHWSGMYQNWNNSCAECHSTDIKKNYDARNDSYSTSFAEVSVGCEACHGAGQAHLAWAQGDQSQAAPPWPNQLKQRAHWAFNDKPIAQRVSVNDNNAQINTCARCHSRRSHLGDYQHGQALSQTHRLALLEPGLYYPDGQIQDEVFVHGSFIQSKMYQAGVTCTDCHNPHSGQTYVQTNALCASCHQAAVFDTPEHHNHQQSSAGAQCVDCHMSTTTYMGVDARRDHSMQVPRPDLTINTGAPNACNKCHDDKSTDWAMVQLSEWGQLRRDQDTERSLAFHAASLGQATAQQALQEIAKSGAQPAIWRASAVNALVISNQSALSTLQLALGSSEPLIRQSAVRQAGTLPDNLRRDLLAPLLGDQDLSVRMALAFGLAGVTNVDLSETQNKQLRELDTEYRAIAERHLDQAEQHLSLGDYETRLGNTEAALTRYQTALEKNPQLLAAYINKADLEANSGNNEAAIGTLESGLAQIKDSPDLAFALGLAHIRAQDYSQGLQQLAAAAKAESARYRYTYAIALHRQGKLSEAIKILKGVSRKWPSNEEALQALTQFAAEAKDTRTALEAARQLTELAPDNRQYRAWRQQLERTAIAR